MSRLDNLFSSDSFKNIPPHIKSEMMKLNNPDMTKEEKIKLAKIIKKQLDTSMTKEQKNSINNDIYSNLNDKEKNMYKNMHNKAKK